MEPEGKPIEPRVILDFDAIEKTFRTGLRRKTVKAVCGISLRVCEGEVYGFLGPNGAGKTTTIKMAMGLIRPTSGSVSLFGQGQSNASARARIGYLPEHPYFYDYLRPDEILDFYGRLFGLGRDVRRERIDRLLEAVGLTHARSRTLRKFSKGMLQRLGIAQALINDPQLLVLDEPLSGLDPIGRKEIRDILAEQRRLGKTIFFSSHILSDIEMICDRVAIVSEGKVRSEGRLDELLRTDQRNTEIAFRGGSNGLVEKLEKSVSQLDRHGEHIHVQIDGVPDDVIKMIIEAGAVIESVTPKRVTLEDLFVAKAFRTESEVEPVREGAE